MLGAATEAPITAYAALVLLRAVSALFSATWPSGTGVGVGVGFGVGVGVGFGVGVGVGFGVGVGVVSDTGSATIAIPHSDEQDEIAGDEPDGVLQMLPVHWPIKQLIHALGSSLMPKHWFGQLWRYGFVLARVVH